MTAKARTTRLSVTIDQELKAAAEDLARKKGITTSKFVSECLKDMIRRHREQVVPSQTTAAGHEGSAKSSTEVIDEIASYWGQSHNRADD